MVFFLSNCRVVASITHRQCVNLPCSYRHYLKRHGHKSAGIIVIGDEVLKGQVLNTNSGYLAKQLHRKGYQVQQVIVVPDNVEKISGTMKTFSDTYDVVLATGGIGPTHDDVTFEALAAAFSDKLYYHPKLVEMCKEFFKIADSENHPGLKLAHIPRTASLTYGVDPYTGKESLYPNISVKNVYIFPGVPSLCEKMFLMLSEKLFPQAGIFYTDCIFFNCSETDLTQTLNRAVEQFPNVVFGSYPQFFHSYYKVKITVESSDSTSLTSAKSFLSKNISEQVHYDNDCFTCKTTKIDSIDFILLKETIAKLISLTDKIDCTDLFLYFDGGKNSLLLLHLLATIYEGTRNVVNVIYVEKNKKVSKYVEKTLTHYSANLLNLDERNFERFMNSDKNIVVVKGTRLSDPHSRNILNYFSKFNSYNPLLHWSYFEVWDVIRRLCLPYCDLYDRGFTSLCSKRNLKLVIEGPRKDIVYYKSAYKLEDEAFE